MTEQIEPKPCPFCGEVPGSYMHQYDIARDYWVECECGIKTSNCNSTKQAVGQWNTRTESALQQRIGELTAKLEAVATAAGKVTDQWKQFVTSPIDYRLMFFNDKIGDLIQALETELLTTKE